VDVDAQSLIARVLARRLLSQPLRKASKCQSASVRTAPAVRADLMAHKDSKFEKGMTPAQRKAFEEQDEKNDAKLAKKVKKTVKKKKKK